MEKRIATQKDKELLKELWSNSFHYTDGFLNWYYDRVFVPENTMVVTEGQDMVSAFSILPQTVKVSGMDVGAAYISGLAILPEYRDEDNMKSQLKDAVAAVSQRGFLLSMLVPPNYRFYEKYGWRTAYSYKQYDIKPADLPAYQMKGNFERAKINETTIEALSDIYDGFTADKNAYTVRDKDAWTLILEDLFYNFGGQCILMRDTENQPVGYMFSIIRDKKMGIYEFAYKNRSAYEGLIGFIHAHELSVDSVVIKAAADDLSYLDFCDNREAVHFCPFAMARISDVKAALGMVAANREEDFKLQIVDRLIEANNKTFQFQNGVVTEVEDAADAITDIGTLTQLFLGYISVKEAVRMNLISGNEEYLYKLFDKKNNYINMLLI